MISGELEQELYRNAIKLWGTESQLDMVIEECAELINAIQKYRRQREPWNNIGSEMADVQNCLNQFIPFFPDFEKERQSKLDRLAVRIEMEKARQEVKID